VQNKQRLLHSFSVIEKGATKKVLVALFLVFSKKVQEHPSKA
jgi:hypothetical protein